MAIITSLLFLTKKKLLSNLLIIFINNESCLYLYCVISSEKINKLLLRDVLISWHCDVNCEAGLFLVVDQHDVRPIVKQMFVSLNGEVQKDSGVIILENFFWFYPAVFTVFKVVLSTHGPVYY